MTGSEPFCGATQLVFHPGLTAPIPVSVSQLGKGEKFLGKGETSICAKFLNFTLHEVAAYAEYMRFTLDELFTNRKFRGHFIEVTVYVQHMLSICASHSINFALIEIFIGS